MNNTKMTSDQCYTLLSEFEFGSFVTSDLQVTHLPYIVGDGHSIEFHLANKNPQLQVLCDTDCLFSILGPHAFISTDFYVTKPAVPTWNYVSLEVRGACEILTGFEATTSIRQTVKRFQNSLLTDKITLPDPLFDELMEAITAVRMEIHDIQGIAKLGQHRSKADQLKVLSSLQNVGESPLANFIQRWTPLK